MKCVIIPQPEATLIATGLKRVHAFGVPFDYTGPIAIQSSHFMDASDLRRSMNVHIHEQLHRVGFGAWNAKALPVSAIVAIAHVKGSAYLEKEPDETTYQKNGFPTENGIAIEQAKFGSFVKGRHIVVFESVRRLVTPIAVDLPKGKAKKSKDSEPAGCFPLETTLTERCKEALHIYASKIVRNDYFATPLQVASLWGHNETFRQFVYASREDTSSRIWQAMHRYDLDQDLHVMEVALLKR